VVVSAPQFAPALRRRYSVLTESLPHAASETRTVQNVFPECVLLQGSRARKPELLRQWEDADCIYFATHVVQDPEVPYLAFVPLASSATDVPDAAYLSPADVRAADLSHCQLAVLSGCSSAVPYVGRTGMVPTLGDAFIDAGASSVVQTLWNVRDADAARTMDAFAAFYKDGRRAPVHALAAAQRHLIEAGAGPAVWAAFTVAVAGFTR
jgi:CHAT domain-containing protein